MFTCLEHCQRSRRREGTLSIWREHLKTLLNRQAPSVPELVHVQGQTYTTVSEEAQTESEVLVCIEKMKSGKSGGDDGISAEILKSLPSSEIREMSIIRSIWIEEMVPDSWRHAPKNLPPQEAIRHSTQELPITEESLCFVL
ncbi:hypothetical protein RB195_022761 [Necator americanus]|uniref:Uncharacterized protein n=1 Tax=Necator americanus TaxID=51031 RepID=A0ABR1EGI1_NECAM